MEHADTLIAMGGAFLAAALPARIGRRAGLPTIPLFIPAGVLLGPFIAGCVLVLALLGPLAASQSASFAKLLPGDDQEKPATVGV